MTYLNLLQIFCLLFSSLLGQNVSAEGSSYFFYQRPFYPRDCHEVFEQCSTHTANGVYLIKPDGYDKAFEVYCDNQTDGGGWTVFQRRNVENSVEFRRNSAEYREGFGFLGGEFWLGNERLSFLTNQKRYQLRIDMTNSAGSSFYVTYDSFRLGDEWSNYKLTSVGQYDGTADQYFVPGIWPTIPEQNNFISQGPATHGHGTLLPFTDCYDVYTSGYSDGVYSIQPTDWPETFDVYCNMSHRGGWTVLQRHVDGTVDFERNWAGYKVTFGTAGPNQNFWLGNEKLHFLTNQKSYELRIDVIRDDGVNWYMKYDLFRVNNETNNYRLELGGFSGSAERDYMANHRGRDFSTIGNDNDGWFNNCAVHYDAGWWYGDAYYDPCIGANLNGVFDTNIRLNSYNPNSLHRLQYTQMKIRPF